MCSERLPLPSKLKGKNSHEQEETTLWNLLWKSSLNRRSVGNESLSTLKSNAACSASFSVYVQNKNYTHAHKTEFWVLTKLN